MVTGALGHGPGRLLRRGWLAVLGSCLAALGSSLAGAIPSSSGSAETPRLIEVRDEGRELGTSYEVAVKISEDDRERAQGDLQAARALCAEFEARLSEWRADSEVSEVNRLAAVRPVPISDTLRRIIEGAAEVSRLTDGAFDVTWKPLGSLWDEAEESGRWPSARRVAAALESVGWRKVRVGDGAVRFLEPGVKLGIAGVAKGWIIDAIFLFLRDLGYDDVIVNIGGDLRTMGGDEGNEGTRAGRRLRIADPYSPEATAGFLEVGDAAVATSGNYFRQRTIEGKRVGHIIDPRTGYAPEFTGSVTVITRDAAMADALATALFVLGPDEGLALAGSIEGVEAIYTTREGLRSTLAVGVRSGEGGVALFEEGSADGR